MARLNLQNLSLVLIVTFNKISVDGVHIMAHYNLCTPSFQLQVCMDFWVETLRLLWTKNRHLRCSWPENVVTSKNEPADFLVFESEGIKDDSSSAFKSALNRVGQLTGRRFQMLPTVLSAGFMEGADNSS